MDLTARTAVLLTLDRPRSGDELVAQISARSRTSRDRAPLNRGNVLPALRRLERDGLVRGWTPLTERGRPDRNYELTVAGVAEAARLLEGLPHSLQSETPPCAATSDEMADGIRVCDELSSFTAALSLGRR